MDYWFSIVHLGHSSPEFIENMFDSLRDERPPILSVVGERSCALQCSHCIFQAEKSSKSLSLSSSLGTAITTIVRQMGANPIVVHEGRIFRPWHLEWLTTIREVRSDVLIGMIDTGAYLDHATQIEQSGFKFDWLDISVDGPEAIHNSQRENADAFTTAMRGIKNARRFIRNSGRITSLLTLTKRNYLDILKTSDALPPEIDEWHITTISPVRPEIRPLATTHRQFNEAWLQIVAANKVRPVFFRIYVAEDIAKLAYAVGTSKFLSAMDRAEVSNCAISLIIDGVSVLYYPHSVAPSETFVLDADAHYRAPYSIAYSLEELRSGVSRFGDDIRAYTIGKVEIGSQFDVLYSRGVENWRSSFGREALNMEISIFQDIQQS